MKLCQATPTSGAAMKSSIITMEGAMKARNVVRGIPRPPLFQQSGLLGGGAVGGLGRGERLFRGELTRKEIADVVADRGVQHRHPRRDRVGRRTGLQAVDRALREAARLVALH